MVGAMLRRMVVGVGLVVSVWAGPVWAADRILVRFGPISTPVEVKDLQTLAATGQASERLATLLGLMGLKPADAQRFLSQSVPMSPDNLNRIVNSFVGNLVLAQVATFVQPANGGDGVTALKTGLSQAIQNNSLSLINLIQSYPGDINLDAQRGMAIYRQIQADAQNLPQVLAALDEILPLLAPGFKFSAGCIPR
ncbi:MAG: alpha/beta hydrolase [Gloeomargarita sp. SKYG116]|nr:alpha/beta hydrolase [Gloeomargarita sp. SKYG116]MCS7226192.1 alpha/beta hydrolase [Gloeomargarita sp. SKYB31]MDW8400232.1 alpha/beta hydrolase [Gloeomargarita sp. SKYGB_i_bin116]